MDDTAYISFTLARVAEVRAGFPFRGSVESLAPGEVGVLQVRDIAVDGQVDWPSVPRKALPPSRAPDFLRLGDILITTRGRRNDAMALPHLPGDTVAGANLFVIRLMKEPPLLPEFLAWQINQRPAQDHLLAAATGSHILNLTRAAVETLPIIVPAIDQQRRLVEMAACAAAERALLSDIIDNRQRQMDALASAFLTGKTIA